MCDKWYKCIKSTVEEWFDKHGKFYSILFLGSHFSYKLTCDIVQDHEWTSLLCKPKALILYFIKVSARQRTKTTRSLKRLSYDDKKLVQFSPQT